MTAKKPKLTVKQAKLVKGIVEGKSQQQAAVEAGYGNTPESAAVIATETLKNVNVQEALQVALAEQGITLEKIVKPIADGLEAYKTGFNKDGEYMDFGPDHSTRLKASSMAQQIINPGGGKGSGTTINNFGTIVGEMKEDYAD